MNKRQREEMRQAMAQNAEKMRAAEVLKDYRARVQRMVADAAADATQQMQRAALAGISPALYLYYLPSTPEQDGRLAMVPQTADAPAGYQLAAPEPLRGNVPYANFHAWIHERAQRLPILAPF